MPAIINKILEQKVLPVYSHLTSVMNRKVVSACYTAGLRCFEFTNRDENAVDEFYDLKKFCESNLPGMELGAGTIKNKTDAEIFNAAGASFLVSPLISAALIEFCSERKLPWIPGCATSSEVGLAENHGIQFVKIFPVKSLGGIEFLQALKGPFPKMLFMATGGINADKNEIIKYLSHAAAIGIGNSFFKVEDTEDQICSKLKEILSITSNAKPAAK